MKRCLVTTFCLVLSLWGVSAAQERPFDYAPWVDHFDFSGHFDSEKPEGLAQILDHVAETGATTILWRNVGGANMRYQSVEDGHHHSSRIDKRRVYDNRRIGGWVRYGEAEPDIVRTVVKMCKERGLRPGIHRPYEETHWSLWTIGRYNLEHPQYWGRTFDCRPWWGRVSIAYEPVIQHKLKLVDELLDRGIECLMLDFWRTGAWGPAYEYVPPVVESYRKKYNEDPPADAKDIRWAKHVAGYVTAYLRRLRRHIKEKNPNVEFMVAVPQIAPINDDSIILRGADWRTWVNEGLVDGIAAQTVVWDKEDPVGSTRKLYSEVIDFVDGRCKVYFPVKAYSFTKLGMPEYQKLLKKPQEEVAVMLATMAWEAGADGITMECVDYNNYREPTRKALKELRETKLRSAKKREAK